MNPSPELPLNSSTPADLFNASGHPPARLAKILRTIPHIPKDIRRALSL
jgi:hypothetical protein